MAGVAALILKDNPSLTTNEVLTRLTSTAEPLRRLTPDQQGAGMVDAEAAADSSSGAPPRYRVSPVSKLTVTWGKLKRQ